MNKYTIEQISKHTTENDLWVIYDGGVYDLSAFSHPGGDQLLLDNGGTDVTEKFNNIDRHKQSIRMDDIMRNLLIGIVEN